MKLVKLLILVVLIPAIIIIFLIAPASLSGEKIRFVIPEDEKQEVTVERLKKDHFIRSARIFNIISGFIKPFGTIEPGGYQLSHNMTALGIADTLLNHPYQKWITLVPGLRVEQTAEKLAKKFEWNDAKTKEFLENAHEGYMFPDTYLLNIDYTGKEFAQRIIANFNEKFDAQIQKDLLAQNVKNDTAIKIASLIERESGSDEDKPIIAGIIWNRINKGMRLEIDATIQYAMGTAGNWWPHVSPSDIRNTDSPYNTYKIKALPPAPICSPSLASIKAVAYSADTDCLYYLHSPDRQIHCAKTYGEHLENIEKYLN